MAMTPEAKVKAMVRAAVSHVCAMNNASVYTFWPVQHGFGAATLDLLGCVNGRAFAVEAKAPGKKPTPRQEACIADMRRAGVTVFVIDGPPAAADFKRWLDDQICSQQTP